MARKTKKIQFAILSSRFPHASQNASCGRSLFHNHFRFEQDISQAGCQEHNAGGRDGKCNHRLLFRFRHSLIILALFFSPGKK